MRNARPGIARWEKMQRLQQLRQQRLGAMPSLPAGGRRMRPANHPPPPRLIAMVFSPVSCTATRDSSCQSVRVHSSRSSVDMWTGRYEDEDGNVGVASSSSTTKTTTARAQPRRRRRPSPPPLPPAVVVVPPPPPPRSSSPAPSRLRAGMLKLFFRFSESNFV